MTEMSNRINMRLSSSHATQLSQSRKKDRGTTTNSANHDSTLLYQKNKENTTTTTTKDDMMNGMDTRTYPESNNNRNMLYHHSKSGEYETTTSIGREVLGVVVQEQAVVQRVVSNKNQQRTTTGTTVSSSSSTTTTTATGAITSSSITNQMNFGSGTTSTPKSRSSNSASMSSSSNSPKLNLDDFCKKLQEIKLEYTHCNDNSTEYDESDSHNDFVSNLLTIQQQQQSSSRVSSSSNNNNSSNATLMEGMGYSRCFDAIMTTTPEEEEEDLLFTQMMSITEKKVHFFVDEYDTLIDDIILVDRLEDYVLPVRKVYSNPTIGTGNNNNKYGGTTGLQPTTGPNNNTMTSQRIPTPRNKFQPDQNLFYSTQKRKIKEDLYLSTEEHEKIRLLAYYSAEDFMYDHPYEIQMLQTLIDESYHVPLSNYHWYLHINTKSSTIQKMVHDWCRSEGRGLELLLSTQLCLSNRQANQTILNHYNKLKKKHHQQNSSTNSNSNSSTPSSIDIDYLVRQECLRVNEASRRLAQLIAVGDELIVKEMYDNDHKKKTNKKFPPKQHNIRHNVSIGNLPQDLAPSSHDNMSHSTAFPVQQQQQRQQQTLQEDTSESSSTWYTRWGI